MNRRKIEDFAALSVIGVDIGKDVFNLVENFLLCFKLVDELMMISGFQYEFIN